MAAAKNPNLQVNDDVTIEAIRDIDWEKVVRDEAFMNEFVTVIVHPTTDENAPSSFVLDVNDKKQPVIRGQEVRMRRMFVEVLARCWETKYKQPVRDMSNPEAGNALLGASALAYPFSVIQDDNRYGPMWLRKIMSERT